MIFFLLCDSGMACSFFYMKPAFVCACAWCFLRMKSFSLWSDTVMGWSFCYLLYTVPSFVFTWKSFSLCSDSVMACSFYYLNFARIVCACAWCFFTHEIFFPLIRYSDGLEIAFITKTLPAFVCTCTLGVFDLFFSPFFMHEIFFPLLRYCDGLELL